jgi:hypothetical protein
MSTINGDVALFNQYVKIQVSNLRARGETVDDLLLNLLRGYRATGDTEFTRYIVDKQDRYEEGEDLTYENLMASALNKYTIRRNRGEWMAPSADQEAIVSLTSEIGHLKDTNLKLTSYLKRGTKPTQNDYKKKSDSRSKSSKPKNSTSSKPKGKPSKKVSDNERWGWKTVPPPSGSPQTKTYQGKSYFWCRYHQAWTIHDPNLPTSDPNCCHKKKELEGNSSDAGGSNDRPKQSANPQSFAASVSNILQAIKEDEQE